MKWKRNLKYWISGLALTIVAVFLMYMAYSLYNDTLYFDDVNTVVTFAIGLVSFLLSVVALIFSVVTYVSIDAVNALSSMEGNVLCNENYNAEYVMLVNHYDDCKTQISLQEKLFSDVEAHFKSHNKTCMSFTDFLQFLLDRLLWFAYVDTKRADYNYAVNDLIYKIEKKYNEFNAISNGNQYVLREHIKLIKNILNYQSVAHEGLELDACGEMLNIRGRMLVNGVSKTVYYDYLGLEYHKKALKKLRAITGFEGEEFVSANMDIISGFAYSDEDKKEINMFLNQAKIAFDNAILSSENDILWKGYISFNKARIDVVACLINNDFPDDNSWQNSLIESIEARYTVRRLFAPDPTDCSFLQLEFAKEHIYAEALFLSVCNYKTKDETQKAKCRIRAKELWEEVVRINTENENIFNRTKAYLADII